MTVRSALVLFLSVGVPEAGLARGPLQVESQTQQRVLVMPFENAGKDPRFSWLSEAAAVLLADELNARAVPAIRRVERVRAFEQLHLPLTASLSRATVIKVGQLVGASEIIVGAYRLDNEQITAEVHSIRTDVGRLQPDVTERAPLRDLFALFQRVAARLSPDGLSRAAKGAEQPPLAAFESYIKGLIADSAATQATFLETAIKEFPAFDRARLALWDVRHEQGDHTSALSAVRPVAADSPFSARARLRAGVSLLELKRYDESFDAFKSLLDELNAAKAAPDRQSIAPVLNNLGVVLIRRGATPQTGSPAYYLTKAADADPADADYRFNLGYSYALAQNYDGAVYWLRETVRRNPTDADAHHVLAAALQATGSPVEAGRERELARQLSSQYELQAVDRPIRGGLERLRVELVSAQDARIDEAILNAAQREQRDLAAFHLDRGRRFFEKEQDRDAMAELRKAVYLLPYEAEAHRLIGRIHLRGGRPQEAVDALKISLWSQESAPARVALAEAYVALKNTAAARSELERALSIDPASADAKRLLSTLK
jgi:tetratricopeptide (TPR) repeat protein